MASQQSAPRPRRSYSKLYYGDPLTVPGGNAPLAAAAAALGCDALVVPPPFPAGAFGDRFAIAGIGQPSHGLPDAGHPVRMLADACQAAGIGAFVDLVLDRVAADSELSAQAPFQGGSGDALDPRHRRDAGVAVADAGTPQRAAALGAWWGAHVAAWHGLGLAGVRLLGLDRLAHADQVVRAIRDAAPDIVLLGWTPGLARPALAGLAGCGLDLVAASLPWWNWRDTWFWDELRALRAVAPVVMAPEAPFGPRLASQGPAAFQRGLGLSALLGDAILVVAGAEHGATAPLDAWAATAASPPADAHDQAAAGIRSLIAAVGRHGGAGDAQPISAPGADALAVLLPDAADARASRTARLVLVNSRLDAAIAVRAATLLPAIGGSFGPFQPVGPWASQALTPASTHTLPPGQVALFQAAALPSPAPLPLDRVGALQAARIPRVCIENPSPCVDGGLFAAKRILGELVAVEADIITDGHDKLAAVLRWQAPGAQDWHEATMVPLGNDRWSAMLPMEALGVYRYDILAWRDHFATYRDELTKKHAAGLPLVLELQEGRVLLHAAAKRAGSPPALAALLAQFDAGDAVAQRDLMLSAAVAAQMAAADGRAHLAQLDRPALVECERSGAGCASWYEVFPRSMSDDAARHGTFADVQRHLPRIAAMGFDVLYFPPFHPIGRTNRKGRNNSLRAEPGDPGSPYAIGAIEGGHDALHPELGTLEDLQRLRDAAAAHGLELAMDFAIQCSPDHPWLKQHKDWFTWRPDGTMRYAENPPKRYEDIVNVDFYAAGAVPDLWLALCDAVLFWASQGIRLFRVDNPHTKPLPFWHWLIREVRQRFPDAVFLSEAFTRPKVMYRLAKVGYSQSYTYFTWRTKKWEFEQYLTELTTTAPRDFFRPHFFVNTPDINPPYLHGANRQAYLVRAALAATLSGLWGVYNGFELCEGTPVPGKEEYLDSEKYQLRVWDWDRPGNIVAEITQLNAIRRANPALHSHLGITFLDAPHDQVLYFEKADADRANVLLVAISLDPDASIETGAALPFWRWGRTEGDAFRVEDLVDGTEETWRGKWHQVRLSPARPYTIRRVSPV